MDYTSFILSNPPPDVDAPIFVDAENPSRSISWQQYASGVKSVAVGLSANGMQNQDCVAILSPNEIYTCVLGDAVTASGAIFTGLPAEAKRGELVRQCKAAQVKWLFAPPQLLDQICETAREVAIDDEHIVIFDPPGSEAASQTTTGSRLRFSNLLNEYNGAEYVNPNADVDPAKQIVSRLFTSGTTGSPKAANISHSATIARIKHGFFHFKQTTDKALHFIGMHHISGTMMRQQAAAGLHGMYITDTQDPANIVDLVRQHDIQQIILPPRMMISVQSLISLGTRVPQDLGSLTEVLVGGSQVPNEAMDAFKSSLPSQAALTPSYGSTELGIITCGSWGKDISPQIIGNVGFIKSPASVKIIEPESQRECGPDQDGEICCTGEQLFNDYCGNAKATREACITDQQGQRWFRTGDKGRFSADNQLSISGRFKQIFKVGTEEVAPMEVEAVLMKYDGIKDAAVTATEDRNDPCYYETKAYIVSAEDKKVDAQELVDFVASQLSCHKAPTGGVTVLNELPRNTMKKVVTRELGNAKPLSGSVGYMDVLSS